MSDQVLEIDRKRMRQIVKANLLTTFAVLLVVLSILVILVSGNGGSQ